MQNQCLSEPILRERGQDADLVRDPTYLLIAIIEKEFQLDASLYTCLQILSVSGLAFVAVATSLGYGPSLRGPLHDFPDRNLLRPHKRSREGSIPVESAGSAHSRRTCLG
jgi:hypothetical protein